MNRQTPNADSISSSPIERLKSTIRDVPDFPKPGIIFKDITPVLGNAELFRAAVELLASRHTAARIDKIAAIEARGFVLGGAVAARLGCGFVPIRKKGKLPFHTHEESYSLEYGTATIAIHTDAFDPGERVVLVDDLLATGGTAAAAARLIGHAGGQVLEMDFLVELSFLNGRRNLQGYAVYAPLSF